MMARGLLKISQSLAHQHMKGPACLAPVYNIEMCSTINKTILKHEFKKWCWRVLSCGRCSQIFLSEEYFMSPLLL